LHLSEDGDALAELEAIESPLRAPNDEAVRHVNQAIALCRLGRAPEARDLLIETLDPTWPKSSYEKAQAILREAGESFH
jgi:hypothetical protein